MLTRFPFIDGAYDNRYRVAGQNGAGDLIPAVTLTDSDGVESSARGAVVDLSATFNRQANTVNYLAAAVVNDATGNPMLFAGAVRKAGGSGYVVSSRLIINAPALTAIQFRLHLYKTTPGAGSAVDNAQWSTAWARRAISLGWIDFLNGISSGSAPDATLWEGVPSSALALPILSTTTDLTAVLTTLSAWATPVTGVAVQVNLRVEN